MAKSDALNFIIDSVYLCILKDALSSIKIVICSSNDNLISIFESYSSILSIIKYCEWSKKGSNWWADMS